MQRILKNYLFWTYPRGSFHYDVMVTLILLFIFITPMPFFHRFIDYGDKAQTNMNLVGPIQVAGDGDYGLVLAVPIENVPVDMTSDVHTVRKAIHRAIQPVTGDAVSVIRWETASYSGGKPTQWKVWIHR